MLLHITRISNVHGPAPLSATRRPIPLTAAKTHFVHVAPIAFEYSTNVTKNDPNVEPKLNCSAPCLF